MIDVILVGLAGSALWGFFVWKLIKSCDIKE